MSAPNDATLQEQLSTRMAGLGYPIRVDVRDGIVEVTGSVTSVQDHQAVMDLVTGVSGVVEVNDQVEITGTSPDSAFDDDIDDPENANVENPAGIDEDTVEMEPDLTDDVGASTSDFQDAVQEAEPYFPPTDPVVHPSRDEEELDVTGGFQDTSTDEVAFDPTADTQQEVPLREPGAVIDDETIRENVVRELTEDALTSDLAIDVEVVNRIVVLRGPVETLDDALNAEAVARRVPGVRDVEERTQTNF